MQVGRKAIERAANPSGEARVGGGCGLTKVNCSVRARVPACVHACVFVNGVATGKPRPRCKFVELYRGGMGK